SSPGMAAVVAVVGATRAPVGCGVLVGPGEVLTCAHVVNLALGLPAHAPDRPNDEIRVGFFAPWPMLDDGDVVTLPARGSERLWIPMEPKAYLGDLALLELDGQVPDGVRPVRLGRGRTYQGHRFTTIGPMADAGFRFEVVRGEIND